MALQVWLPLTNDLKNQGLTNITSSGTPVFKNSGKLGSKSLDLNTRVTFNCPTIANKTTFSIAFWAKVNDDASLSTDWVDVIGFTDISTSGTSGVLRWETCYSSSGKIRGISGHDNATYAITNGPNGNYTTKNAWHHIVCTVGTDVREYRDGILSGTYTANGGHLTGAFWLGESGKINGEIQDVRIYDHCLSPMEVKQLSQGLVLHYPLNRQGWGQENLLKNTNDLTKWNKESGISVEWDETELMYKVFTTTRESSRWGIYQDYAITVDTDTDYTFSLTGKTDGFTAYLSFGAGTSWPSNYIAFTTTKQRLSKTLTIPAGTTNIRVYLAMYPQTGGGHVYFEKPKLEKGSVATTWCPNSSDDLATTMGLNDNIEYDCSGFCNNGTRTGTFTWTSDTPKYQVSQVFNGTDNAIQTPSLPTMVTDKNYTVVCWTYKTVIGTKNYQTIYGGPGGFELEARSSSSTSPLYRIHNWGGGTTSYNFGEWTHFCFVHTDSDSKLYVNGELKITGTSANIPSGNYFVGAWNTSTSQNYEGLMSDFRIYATALSADDVKSLYQNSAYIDSSGNVYGAVHSEV